VDFVLFFFGRVAERVAVDVLPCMDEYDTLACELVAELGAAFLCADLELTPEPGMDHAAYIQSWLKVLKDDKRAIFAAAAHAQRAADFLHGLQPMIEEKGKAGGAA